MSTENSFTSPGSDFSSELMLNIFSSYLLIETKAHVIEN